MSDNLGENSGGLNLPTAEGNAVDEALRTLLKALSESPGATENFQLTLNVSGGTAPQPNPDLDFTAGIYLRQVVPDAANPALKKIVITFLPDNPLAAPESDIQPFNPGDKATWRRLLNDPVDIDIDTGITILHMDSNADNFTVTWLSNDDGVAPLRAHHSKADETGVLPPTVNLTAFLDCTRANAQLSYPARLSHCMPQLLA